MRTPRCMTAPRSADSRAYQLTAPLACPLPSQSVAHALSASVAQSVVHSSCLQSPVESRESREDVVSLVRRRLSRPRRKQPRSVLRSGSYPFVNISGAVQKVAEERTV